jgi:hypothetical protein
MIFEGELAKLVMRGEKVVTRRLCSENPRSPWYVAKCALTRGKVVKVNPGRGVSNIGAIEVLSVRKERLGDVFPTDASGAALQILEADREALLEGFVDSADFVAAWRRINGEWNPDAMVWRIQFAVSR